MLKWSGSNKVQVGLDWFDAGVIFSSLYLEEVLGGDLAWGRIRLISSGSGTFLKKVTDENFINLTVGTVDSGPVLTIHGIITKREYFDSCIDLTFEAIPDIDFTRRKTIMTYDDIDAAIKSLWRGKIDKRPDTVSNLSGIKFHQANEFDCEYLGKLCSAYNKDVIFACGLDNLLIKNLIGIDSTGHNEPYWTITSKGDTVTPINSVALEKFNLHYDRDLYKEPIPVSNEFPNSQDPIDSKNFDIRMYDQRYKIIRKDHTPVRENLYWNQRIYDSPMYNQETVIKDDIFSPTYRLGDVVYYLRPGKDEVKLAWEVYLISKIQYYIRSEHDSESSGLPGLRQQYTLHCLEEKNARMPGVGADPMG